MGGQLPGNSDRPKHSTGARHNQGIQALQTTVSPSQEFQDTKSSGGRHGKPNGTWLCQLQGMLKASCCSGTQTLDDVRPKSSTLPAFPRFPLKLGNGLFFYRGQGSKGRGDHSAQSLLAPRPQPECPQDKLLPGDFPVGSSNPLLVTTVASQN